LGGAWQGHSGGGISGLGQTRAVETRVPAVGSVDWRRVLIPRVLYSSVEVWLLSVPDEHEQN
jgi:hypothetical protein